MPLFKYNIPIITKRTHQMIKKFYPCALFVITYCLYRDRAVSYTHLNSEYLPLLHEKASEIYARLSNMLFSMDKMMEPKVPAKPDDSEDIEDLSISEEDIENLAKPDDFEENSAKPDEEL